METQAPGLELLVRELEGSSTSDSLRSTPRWRPLPGRASRTAAGAHGVRPGGPLPRRPRRGLRRAAAAQRPTSTTTSCSSSSTATTTLVDTGARQAGPRAGRGPADRLRGRLRHALRTTRRTADVRSAAARRCARRSTRVAPRPSRASASRASRRPPARRGLRTLALFLEDARGRPLPDGFVVTLPKVTAVEQVEALVHAAERLEAGLGPRRTASLRFEIQVETPQSILGPDGTALVARMIHASQRAAAPACTTAPTTTRPSAASPPPTRASSTPPPTTPRR